jgi:AcrR family transcriptional regulator
VQRKKQTAGILEESETRERLLSQAEKMFATRGYDGTSVRRITESAGANVAAVSYYFGGKEGLYQAVFERVLEEMRERRIRRIEADLEAAGAHVTLETFLKSFGDAFVEPLVEGDRGNDFISLFDQEMRLHRMPTRVFFERLIEPMLTLFVASLERVDVSLDRPAAAMCLMSLVGQLAHAVKGSRRFASHPAEEAFPLSLEKMIPHIVRFSAAGIRASASADDGREK